MFREQNPQNLHQNIGRAVYPQTLSRILKREQVPEEITLTQKLTKKGKLR